MVSEGLPQPSKEDVVTIARQLVEELKGQAPSFTLNLDHTLEKDLGLDSLARVELISRIERTFKLALPDQTFAEAESLRDLWNTLQQVQGHATSASVVSMSARRAVDDDPTVPAQQAKTLQEVLHWHAERSADGTHIRFYSDTDDGETLTFKQLQQGAMKIAAGLQRLDLSPGAAVAIMLPSDATYFLTFMGVLLAGGVPVPLYPPARKTQLEDHLRRHQAILTNCASSILITFSEIQPLARLMRAQVESLRSVVTPEELLGQEGFTPPVHRPEDVAFLQYTSGSTGAPKGVVLTHANLLHNIRAMGHRVQAGPEDVFVSWLPLYHDMGLIGAWLGSLHYGAELVLLSPLQFISRPQRWLQAIHRYRGTLSASPDFGYALCLREVQNRPIEGLDLSSWRAAFNGAEAINPQTMHDFIDHFSSYGFKREAMMPVYGLAESSVGLCFPPLNRGPRIDQIHRDPLARQGRAIPYDGDPKETPLQVVACGFPLENHHVRVADVNGYELEERREGRLQFQGPSSTSGYFRNPEATRQLFQGEWLDTGDLGYMADGEIFITGRRKDLIIRAGRNIYPVELEEAIGGLDGVRTGNVAVFGTPATDKAPEQLIVVAEVRTKAPEDQQHIRDAIQQLAIDLTSIPADQILLAEPGTVLKTSSGKIRRGACRDAFVQGRLGKPGKSVGMQWLRLAMTGVVPEMRRQWHALTALAFASYGWILFYLFGAIMVPGVILLPTLRLRWALARSLARSLRFMTRTPVAVEGLNHLPDEAPCIVVANHMSYLDSYLLVACLPRDLHFVAKAELKQKTFLAFLLQRMGVEFVERFGPQRGVEDARRLGQVAQQGRSLMFFAEGTFYRTPGLQPFRMGAFITATSANVPIIPVAIRGTRSMLRAGSWFPRRGRLKVTLGPSIRSDQPAGASPEALWQAAIQLRAEVREHILRYCGEPDLQSEALD